mgnify:CR=1 FL=1|jgi:hypothetical protein
MSLWGSYVPPSGIQFVIPPDAVIPPPPPPDPIDNTHARIPDERVTDYTQNDNYDLQRVIPLSMTIVGLKYDDSNYNIKDAKNNTDILTTNSPTTSTIFREVPLDVNKRPSTEENCYFAVENRHGIFSGIYDVNGKFGRKEDNCFFAIKLKNTDTTRTAILRMIEDLSDIILHTNIRYLDSIDVKTPKAIIRKLFIKDDDGKFIICYFLILLMNGGIIMKTNQIMNPRLRFESIYASDDYLN